MKSWNLIKKLSTIVWKIIVAMGVCVGLWAGYDQLLKKPSIYGQIIGDVNVLDINEPVQDLQVLFKNEDVQEKNRI